MIGGWMSGHQGHVGVGGDRNRSEKVGREFRAHVNSRGPVASADDGNSHRVQFVKAERRAQQ